MDALKAHPQVEQVEVLQAPIQPSTQTVLSGSTSQVNLPRVNPAIRFKLKLTLKPLDGIAATTGGAS